MPHGIQALVVLLGSHISDDGPGKEVSKFLHGGLDELGLAPQLGREEAVRRLQGRKGGLHKDPASKHAAL